MRVFQIGIIIIGIALWMYIPTTVAAIVTPVPTLSRTPSATMTPSLTTTTTNTRTASRTRTETGTRTNTHTATNTRTWTATPTRSNTRTATRTRTETGTRTNTHTATNTRTWTATPTRSNTRTATRTRTETRTHTATQTRTATRTRSNTRTNTPTRTATNTRTNTPTRTATRTHTPTVTPIRTNTPSATATRLSGTLVPADMMGLVGRDPYFEVNNNILNTQAIDQMGIEMAQLGVRWVRIDIRLPVDYWASDAAVTTAISRYDYFINTVAPRHQIKVLLLLNFDVIMGVDANELARGPYSTDLKYGPNYNKYMQVWMGRAWQIVARYGTKIGAIEVLNEQNRLPRYTSNGPVGNAVPAVVVAQLTTTLYRACRGGSLQTYCATTPIILGGLHPRGSDAQVGIPAQTDMAYLAAIYASSAFQQAYSELGRWPLDAVGYHSYPWELAFIGVRNQTQAYDRLRAQLVALNDPLRPVWVTEIGYNVAYSTQTEIGQANYLGAVYRVLASRLLSDGSREIPVVFWFKYEDFPPDTGSNAQKWGLVHIPFVAGNCTGGACYQTDGRPSYYRLAWYVYRDLH